VNGENSVIDTNRLVRACARVNNPKGVYSALDREVLELIASAPTEREKIALLPSNASGRIMELLQKGQLIVPQIIVDELNKFETKPDLEVSKANKHDIRILLNLLKPAIVKGHWQRKHYLQQKQVFEELKKRVDNIVKSLEKKHGGKLPQDWYRHQYNLNRHNYSLTDAANRIMAEMAHIKECKTWKKIARFYLPNPERSSVIKSLDPNCPKKWLLNDLQIIMVAHKYNARIESSDVDLKSLKKVYDSCLSQPITQHNDSKKLWGELRDGYSLTRI